MSGVLKYCIKEMKDRGTDGMRVLSVVWKIYDDRLQGFSDDTNGLIVVRDMCEYIGRRAESYLLLGKDFLPDMKLGNISIVDSESIAKRFYWKSHLEIMIEAFKRALFDIRPDIVHFHDSGDFCRGCINVCIERKVPYVFTAHNFIAKKQIIPTINDRYISWQNKIYKMPDINIVAVGKGVADKIYYAYPELGDGRLRIIQNGTTFKAEKINSKLQFKLNLQEKKILICPGKITKRKNQIQIVKAYKLLPPSVSKNIGIVFCGNDRLDGEMQRVIQAAGVEDSLKYVGTVSSEQMKEYYSISSGMITASLAEGLSIAALEAIAYGLPVIMFSDLECAVDLDDEHVSCLAEQRTDVALAKAIQKWVEKEWDRDIILKFASQFSMEKVANKYIKYYEDILKRTE